MHIPARFKRSAMKMNQCHQRGIFPVRVSRGTEPCDGVEQKTCLSGASLFCVRHRASTGVCLRSRPNGVGVAGSPEGEPVPPLGPSGEDTHIS